MTVTDAPRSGRAPTGQIPAGINHISTAALGDDGTEYITRERTFDFAMALADADERP